MSAFTDHSRAHRNAARSTTVALVATVTAISLSGCLALPGQPSGGSDATGVDFEGVQSATIQLEAKGTFVDPDQGAYEASGRGSGFIITEDGLAITNNHVVVGAGTIDVWRGGDQSETLNARVVASSECLDLAVVQLPEGTYPFMSWRKGEISTATDVYAAGFPLGDPDFTLTRGIVSKASTNGETNWASVDSVIEHDARIRPGNSGGPLVDDKGRVVGVNYAGNDQYDYSFAIHRDEVLAVLDDMIDGKSVLSLGVNARAITSEEGEGLGIWVSSVAAGSAADKAGIQPGDVLTRMQGVSLGTDGTLSSYCDVLRTHGQDATLDVEVFRPSEGAYYRGQFNGDELEPFSVLGSDGGDAGSTGEFVTVTDETNTVSVEVPAAWDDVDGSAFEDGDTNQWVSVQASPNLDGYQTGWATPGVTVAASEQAVDSFTPAEMIETTTSGLPDAGCTNEDADSYEDGIHTGEYSYWTGCGDEGASYLVVAAKSNDGKYIVLVTVQANSEADLDAVDRALGSFYAAF